MARVLVRGYGENACSGGRQGLPGHELVQDVHGVLAVLAGGVDVAADVGPVLGGVVACQTAGDLLLGCQRARQRDQAGALVAGHGDSVAEFFDIGQSRTSAWPCGPPRWSLRWPIRTGGRTAPASMAPLFVHYEGRAMDTGGWRPVGNGEDDGQLMLALGLQSKREITRIRVRTALAAQTRGTRPVPGRPPPYG